MKKTFIIVLIGLACLIMAPSANSETIINGVKEGVSGSVSESDISTINHAATEKANLVDADEVTGQDSADSFNLIRTTWTSVKAFLKTYFDGLYATTADETFTGTHTLPAMAFTPLTAAPGSPVAGTWYYADNDTWDPITYAGTANYWVIYDGASYIGIIDEDGVWLISSLSLGGIVLGDTTPDAIGELGYASGKFLFFGANSEDLYLEVGSAANTVAVGSNTGIDTIDLGAINLLTSGTIGSKFPTVAGGAADLSLSVAQVSGTNISNTGQGVNNRNHTLPVAEAGLVFIGSVGEAQGASYYRFTANTTPTPDDFMCLNGTCGKTYVSIAAPTQGAQVMCRTEQIASTGIKTGAALAIGTTNTAVANGAFTFDIGGTGYAKAATAAGTAPGNDVIPQSSFGAVAFDIGADGTIDAIEATDNATGYASAVLAVAGLPAVAAAHTRMGNVTASKSDGTFTFGTTALDAASTTVAYTSSTAYTKPYNWMCNSSVGTWVTD